jgi:hypothetical protein
LPSEPIGEHRNIQFYVLGEIEGLMDGDSEGEIDGDLEGESDGEIEGDLDGEKEDSTVKVMALYTLQKHLAYQYVPSLII